MSPDSNESLRGSDSSNLYCLFQMLRPREVEGQLHGELVSGVEPSAFDRR